MTSRLLGALATLGLLITAGACRAQETVFYGGEAMDGSMLLTAEAVPGQPLFAAGPVGAPLPAGPAGLATQTNASFNGSAGLASLGVLQIGFDYLRPLWTFRDFTLAVPAGSAGPFLLGDIGHVDTHFAFVPRVIYNYEFVDLDFGVSASGTFLNLTGNLRRQIGSVAGGVGDLTANSQLTIVTANLLEFTKRVPYADVMRRKALYCEALSEMIIDLSIGARYSSIDQNYTGSLASSPGGTNVTTRYSTQSFRGFGLTGSADLSLPVAEDWALFSENRVSILIGDNRKDSTVTVAVSGLPGVAEKISQNESAILPVVEMALGVQYTTAVLGQGGAAAPTWITVRTALVSQYWGDVGPLSAGSTQGFRTSDLFLVGASVLVGIHR